MYGNTIDFTYTRDEGLNYIGEIKYGPNVITFHYKLRSDKNTLFIKGKPMKQQLIADHINISYNSVLVRKYQFKYNYLNSVYNGYSVLNEVTEYGTDNFWYNSTAFTYQKPDTVAFSRTTGNSTHSVITYKSDLYPGDFNGDAKNDFLCLPNANASWTGYKIYHGDGNGNFTLAHQSTTFSFGTPEDVRILDLNGDGKDDIICEIADSGTSTFKYILNSGSVFSYSVIYL